MYERGCGSESPTTRGGDCPGRHARGEADACRGGTAVFGGEHHHARSDGGRLRLPGCCDRCARAGPRPRRPQPRDSRPPRIICPGSVACTVRGQLQAVHVHPRADPGPSASAATSPCRAAVAPSRAASVAAHHLLPWRISSAARARRANGHGYVTARMPVPFGAFLASASAVRLRDRAVAGRSGRAWASCATTR